MPFEVGGFGSSSQSFDGRYAKKFEKQTNFKPNTDIKFKSRLYDFQPDNEDYDSETKFYNRDSLWSRWRRGYDLYSITQTYMGTSSKDRNTRGDFRMYVAFQQFPGVFIPARVFTFPSSTPEMGTQMVGIRDANSFSFYNFGLPITAVRYLKGEVSGTYAQSGTTITVTSNDHGLETGDDVFLDFTTGSGVDATLAITGTTQNTFTCTAAASVTTSGNVVYRKETTFSDLNWEQMRVKIRFIPTPVNFFAGERLADRVIERDPGIFATYSQSVTTITVNCTAAHGLATGNEVLLVFTSGTAIPGLYDVTVTSATQFTVTSVAAGTTAGAAIVNRRIRGYDYEDYVGYTVTGTDKDTNEILFQRDDSYGEKVIDNKPTTVTPAHRGFKVDRYLTTEVRYQCSCQDFMRRDNFNLYSEAQKRKFPVTQLNSVKPGQRIDRENNLIDTRDDVGVYSDFGYVAVNNFYNLPTYEDGSEFSYPNLMYYQTRWCKHIYAAMWSIVHDEGNEPINLSALYSQDGGPNITVTATDHRLGVNTRIRLDFTSGSAIDGEYTVSEVVDKDNFKIVYPFSNTTLGYCVVRNLKNHEYVGSWLLEPNDQPLGVALERFYDKLEKENDRIRMQAERMSMMSYGMPWSGAKEISGDRNQPTQVGNFDDNLVSMMMTDSIRRNDAGELDRSGRTVNSTVNMLQMMNKLFNIDPDIIQDTKIGMLDQPLTDYTSDFQFGEIDGGTYVNGTPVSVGTSSELDCRTYSPFLPQPILVDSGLYINN